MSKYNGFHPPIIEILEPYVEKSEPEIRNAFKRQDFPIKVKEDIYNRDINNKLIEIRKENLQKFEEYMKIIDFLIYLFEKKTYDTTTTQQESSIHSLDALNYKAHNQLKFSHSSESYALAFED